MFAVVTIIQYQIWANWLPNGGSQVDEWWWLDGLSRIVWFILDDVGNDFSFWMMLDIRLGEIWRGVRDIENTPRKYSQHPHGPWESRFSRLFFGRNQGLRWFLEVATLKMIHLIQTKPTAIVTLTSCRYFCLLFFFFFWRVATMRCRSEPGFHGRSCHAGRVLPETRSWAKDQGWTRGSLSMTPGDQFTRASFFWVIYQKPDTLILSGWWFQTLFIFHNIWDNPSHWLIFFKMG